MGCVCVNPKKPKISSVVVSNKFAICKINNKKNYLYPLTKTTLIKILDFLKYSELITAGKINRYT